MILRKRCLWLLLSDVGWPFLSLGFLVLPSHCFLLISMGTTTWHTRCHFEVGYLMVMMRSVVYPDHFTNMSWDTNSGVAITTSYHEFVLSCFPSVACCGWVLCTFGKLMRSSFVSIVRLLRHMSILQQLQVCFTFWMLCCSTPLYCNFSTSNILFCVTSTGVNSISYRFTALCFIEFVVMLCVVLPFISI